MTEIDNSTKDLKFYSNKSIGLSTFLGGPLAAGYLIRENYRSLNKPDEGTKAMYAGIIATIVIFGGIFMIPDAVMDKLPNQIFPAIYTSIIYLIVEKIHGPLLKQHEENGYTFYSGWKAAGVGGVSLVFMVAGIFGFAYFSTDNEVYEKYDIEIARFAKNETETLVFFDHLTTQKDKSLIRELNNITIPKWEENLTIIKNLNNIKDLPIELVEQNKVLLAYAELRIKAFTLFEKAIREESTQYNSEIEKINSEIEAILAKMGV
mgnify:CR=1 FL=1|tara:strand:+ start:9896 stop:10684 length:789 start_codon:yes stop_codon:yes gene_type:complete